jgi:hypothetical protein
MLCRLVSTKAASCSSRVSQHQVHALLMQRGATMKKRLEPSAGERRASLWSRRRAANSNPFVRRVFSAGLRLPTSIRCRRLR